MIILIRPWAIQLSFRQSLTLNTSTYSIHMVSKCISRIWSRRRHKENYLRCRIGLSCCRFRRRRLGKWMISESKKCKILLNYEKGPKLRRKRESSVRLKKQESFPWGGWNFSNQGSEYLGLGCGVKTFTELKSKENCKNSRRKRRKERW